MTTARALVTPTLLSWARKSVHLRVDEAAKKIGVSEDMLNRWESGDGLPTLNQARKTAEVYRRPLAVFYLDEVPTDFALIRDFRKLPSEDLRNEYSYYLMLQIREMQFRQRWVREVFGELKLRRLSFVGSVKLRTSIRQVSEDVRKKLRIALDDQLSWRSLHHALNVWVERAEELRVFVSQTSAGGKIGVEDARGFALADPFAPFVFLNAKDSVAGRIFTLAHELAHIWLGESGVSGTELRGDEGAREGRVERFCNAVASQVVFPDEAFRRFFPMPTTERDASERIDLVSKNVFVSRDVIARRLRDEDVLSQQTYEKLHARYIREWKSRETAASGGSYYVNHVRAVGKSFVRLVADVYARGRVTGSEAAGLIHAKLDKMPRLVATATSGAKVGNV